MDQLDNWYYNNAEAEEVVFMKKRISILGIIFLSFFACINNANAEYDYSQSCYPEAIEELAKIIYSEVGGTFTGASADKTENFLIRAATGAVAVNLATKDQKTSWMSSKSNWDRKLYYLTDTTYQGHSSYKNKSFDQVTSGLSKNEKGKLLYISALILSGKFTFRSDLVLQAADYIVRQYSTGEWHNFAPYDVKICFMTSSEFPNTGKDAFGNSRAGDVSYEAYKRLAQAYMLDDYSEYTRENTCKKVANVTDSPITPGNSGNSGNPESSEEPLLPDEDHKITYEELPPLCENPEVLNAFYIILSLIDVIKIVIPVILLLISTIDLFKALFKNDVDDLPTIFGTLLKRIVIGLLIYFVPVLLELIIVDVGNLSSDPNFTDCIENATLEKIAEYEEKYKTVDANQ